MSQWFHGFRAVIVVLGSIAALAGTIITILVTLDVIGRPPNQPPIAGNITLDRIPAISGQRVGAEVGVSDPDRDELVIQWNAETGRFPAGDTGKRVIYEPPRSGASFQLTAIISDGHNEPVRVSEQFALAMPTPMPREQPIPTPPVAAITPNPLQATPFAQHFVTAVPNTGPVDLTGVWDYGNGYLEISPASGDEFNYVEYSAFDVEVGQGTVTREGDRYLLEGVELLGNPLTGFPEVVVYTGTLEVLNYNTLRARLHFENAVNNELTLTRGRGSTLP